MSYIPVRTNYDPVVTAVAAVMGLDPGVLDMHVEGIHGWEPHDVGYEDAVRAAAECEQTGGCATPQDQADVPPGA